MPVLDLLGRPLSVAEILDKLVLGDEENRLMAYQIAFDLYESATQQFLERVLVALRATAPIPSLLEEKVKPKPVQASAESDEAEASAEPKKEIKEEKSLESLVRYWTFS